MARICNMSRGVAILHKAEAVALNFYDVEGNIIILNYIL